MNNRKTLYTHPFRILVVIVILALASCSRESDKLVPQTASGVRTASAPAPADSPVARQSAETTAGLFFPKSPLTGARTTNTDYVDFDDQMALTIIPEYAASTFATAPFYIQQVGTAWVHVKENNEAAYSASFRSNYGHYHLSYQNFVPCITNGTFGKPSGNNCVAINPALEPRTLNTHYGDEWIKIYAYDYTNPSRKFDLLKITVTTGPIQLWFKKTDGSWWHWSSLGTGTWNLSAHCVGITQVLISGTSTASIGFDNVQIRVPYY